LYFIVLHYREDWCKSFLHRIFAKNVQQTRLVIDGAEIRLDKPIQPLAQQGTYSTYKDRNMQKHEVHLED